MLKDLHMADGTLAPPKAGWLPFGALALGLIIVFGANYYFHGGL